MHFGLFQLLGICIHNVHNRNNTQRYTVAFSFCPMLVSEGQL